MNHVLISSIELGSSPGVIFKKHSLFLIVVHMVAGSLGNMMRTMSQGMQTCSTIENRVQTENWVG